LSNCWRSSNVVWPDNCLMTMLMLVEMVMNVETPRLDHMWEWCHCLAPWQVRPLNCILFLAREDLLCYNHFVSVVILGLYFFSCCCLHILSSPSVCPFGLHHYMTIYISSQMSSCHLMLEVWDAGWMLVSPLSRLLGWALVGPRVSWNGHFTTKCNTDTLIVPTMVGHPRFCLRPACPD